MYKLIGSDQVEYGPVSADQVRQWISEGRVQAQTRMQAEGSAEWRTAQEFPEFAEALGSRALAPRTGPPPRRPELTGPVRTSGMAIGSLVLGILGFVTCGLTLLITAPLGLVLGLVAINKIEKSRGALQGRGLALAGTIVSGASLILLPIMAGMLLPAFAKAKSKAQTIQCVNNLKQLALAARIYAADHRDRFPAAEQWCDQLARSGAAEKVFKCPAGHGAERCHYAFNAQVAGAESANLAPDTVLFFETEGGWNVSGGGELWLERPRHARLFVVGFADGHVEQVTEARLGELRWER